MSAHPWQPLTSPGVCMWRRRNGEVTSWLAAQVVSVHPEILHRLKVLAEGRMRHNKTWLHAQLSGGASGMQLGGMGMQGGAGMGGMGPPGMLDVGPVVVHKPTVDFRAPMPRMPVRPGPGHPL